MTNSLKCTLASELDRFVYKMDVPAAAVGIIDQEGLLLEVGGVCGRDDLTPVQRDDQWHIGSCTKSITAVLFGLLVEKRKVNWGSTLAEVLPDLTSTMHEDWYRVSLDEIFYCRSGMPANPSASFMRQGWLDSRPLAEQRTALIKSVLMSPPKNRGKFLYSNLGYIVIGAVIDRIGEGHYEEILQSMLFNPLNIHTSGFGAPAKIKGHSALIRAPWAHMFKGKSCCPDLPESDNPAVFSSAGTLHISLPDWAKFLAQFLAGGKDRVIPDTVTDALFQAPPDFTMTRGLGRVDHPAASFAMQGSNTMWVATVVINKQRDKIALVVCNDGRSSLLRATAELALKLLQTAR